MHTFNLSTYAGTSKVLPRVPASEPEPCGGNKTILTIKFPQNQTLAISVMGLGSCFFRNILIEESIF